MEPFDILTFKQQQAVLAALQVIARGRTDCGRPIAGENARQVARAALHDNGLTWSEQT